MESQPPKRKKRPAGRKPSPEPARHRYYFKLTDTERVKFEELFLSSGLEERSKFIRSVIFGREIRIVKVDQDARDYFVRLTNFYVQFQRVGNNYNQTVRAIKANFGEKRGLAMLYRLEKATAELAGIGRSVLELCREYEKIWLPK